MQAGGTCAHLLSPPPCPVCFLRQNKHRKAGYNVELQPHTDSMYSNLFAVHVSMHCPDHMSTSNIEVVNASLHSVTICEQWSASCRGSFWGSLRAGVQPMFHSTHLNTYTETINQAVDDLAVNLDKVAEAGEEVDIFRQLGRMTMQVIGAAAFG